MAFTAVLRDLNKLNTFVRVAQGGSFTRAAAELRTRPSVVSRRIKELEDALGFTLLNRSTHGLVLTEAGEGLYRQGLDMLAKLDTYIVERRNIETGPFGTLRVQAASGYALSVLAPLVAHFVRSRPGLRVHLSVVSENAVPVESSFDVIISTHKPTFPGVVTHDLGVVRHVICAAPSYFSRHGRPKTPQDLKQHNCLADLYAGPKSWPFRSSRRPLLVEVKGSLSSNSDAVLVDMALRGHGIVRVPYHTVKPLIADKRLAVIFRNISLSPERIGLHHPKMNPLPAKTSYFIDFLKAAVSRGN